VTSISIQSVEFAPAIERHRKLLLKVGRAYGRNEADRQDLIQEITIQLWRSWSTFDGRSQLSTWLYRVALNVAISWSRNEFRRCDVSSLEDAPSHELATGQSADRSLADLELLDQMFNSLEELDRALMLLHLEGHEHTFIADVLGVTTTNVATKINRIKQRLQQQFNGR
jgi:RNA polymerase sigma factor (sigma-70 family)